MSTGCQCAGRAKIEAAAAEWIGRRDAGLTPAEQEDFRRWCEEREAHRAALARLDSTWRALVHPLARGEADTLRQELAIAQRRRRLRTLRATVAVMVCLAGAWSIQSLQRSAESTAAVWTPERLELPDGSIAELSKGAEIAQEFSAHERRVLLKGGEAHFAVAPDAARPFRVLAGRVEVRAVGTAFAVGLSDSVVELIVTEGRVAAGPAHNLPAGENRGAALVSAGQRASFEPTTSAASEIVAMTEAEIAERLAWRNPRVEFSMAPLSEVVALLNQHASIRFVIADRALGATPLSGVFRLNDTEAFLRMLERGFGVVAERSGNTVVLRKAG